MVGWRSADQCQSKCNRLCTNFCNSALAVPRELRDCPHPTASYTALRASVPSGAVLHPRGEVAEWLNAAVSKPD